MDEMNCHPIWNAYERISCGTCNSCLRWQQIKRRVAEFNAGSREQARQREEQQR